MHKLVTFPLRLLIKYVVIFYQKKNTIYLIFNLILNFNQFANIFLTLYKTNNYRLWV